MLRWNAILPGLLLCGALVVGCQDQNKGKEGTAPDQTPQGMTIETPAPPPVPLPPPAPEATAPVATTPPTAPPDTAVPDEMSSKQLPKESYAKKSSRSKSRVYTTKSGDTLQKIAKRYYNDPKKWRTIYDANRRQIKDPDKIPVGKKLIIP